LARDELVRRGRRPGKILARRHCESVRRPLRRRARGARPPGRPGPSAMTVFQALVLGLLQGLSEFLPVSSSAHLTLAPWMFHWKDPGLSFDVALHAGTLLALLWYFRSE